MRSLPLQHLGNDYFGCAENVPSTLINRIIRIVAFLKYFEEKSSTCSESVFLPARFTVSEIFYSLKTLDSHKNPRIRVYHKVYCKALWEPIHLCEGFRPVHICERIGLGSDDGYSSFVSGSLDLFDDLGSLPHTYCWNFIRKFGASKWVQARF